MERKWKQAWAEVGGKRFFARSRWEVVYAKYLQWLVEQKQIADWEHEPLTFWFAGIRRGVCSYKPDFRVTELDGRTYYVEVKGYMDPKSKTKLKRMAKHYPDVKLGVVNGRDIADLRHKLGAIVQP